MITIEDLQDTSPLLSYKNNNHLQIEFNSENDPHNKNPSSGIIEVNQANSPLDFHFEDKYNGTSSLRQPNSSVQSSDQEGNNLNLLS